MSILENPKIYKLIPDILENSPIVIELGANDGLDTVEIAKNCKGDYKIYSFEPDPRTAEFVRKRNLPNVTVVEEAISNTVGETVLYQFFDKKNPDDMAAMGPSSIFEPNPYEHWLPHLRHEGSIIVKTNTLDNFCKVNGIQQIDFLWVDIQGAEFAMIEGGKEMLKNTKWMFLETLEKPQYKGQKARSDVLETLSDWEVVEEWPVDVYLRNKRFDK